MGNESSHITVLTTEEAYSGVRFINVIKETQDVKQYFRIPDFLFNAHSDSQKAYIRYGEPIYWTYGVARQYFGQSNVFLKLFLE